MARRDPLLPNALIVARREYAERVRSKLFRVSTVVLMALAVGVAMTPIVMRYLERQSVDRILVVAADDQLALATIATADGIMNIPPPGADPARWTKPYRIERATDRASAEAELRAGRADAVIEVGRASDEQLQVVYRTLGPVDGVQSQLAGFTALSVGILDWTSSLPADSALGAFQTPVFETESLGFVPGSRVTNPVTVASRAFLGTVFIILMFITILIYGMWVATGVAAEKSSRVMELMISAASPGQMLVGKVVGIGAAGLTQYVAIAIPAVVILALQEPIARAVLGDGGSGLPVAGLTLDLLVAYGVFFLLGFTLFALIYAAVGSFVGRPDDLQTLSLPLSLVAMAGYLSALTILLGGAGLVLRAASFAPPLSPFAMLARIMVDEVAPWEIAVSVGLLVAAIWFVGRATVRIYATGVLLYGQRPGFRAFIAAARRAG